MKIAESPNREPLLDMSDPSNIAIVGKLVNLMFAIVDEPALGADEGFTRTHLLHSCRLVESLLVQPL